MKKISTLVTVVTAIAFSSHAQNTWTQKADCLGGERSYAAGFSVGDMGYIGTGYDGINYKKDFWEYDPSVNTWTQKADFGGVERYYAIGFNVGDKGYIGTGTNSNSGPLKDFWEYDPSANAWTQKADFGGGKRTNAVEFSIGDKGYVGTGANAQNILEKDFWEYDQSTDVWTQKGDFGGSARHTATGFSIEEKGYVGTGWDGISRIGDFWEYDPTADSWTQKADFGGVARNDAAGFCIGNKGYLGTGLDNDVITHSDFWEYDPATDTWTQKTDFGGASRGNAVSFSIGNKGYIGTGWVFPGTFYFQDLWEYAPDIISSFVSNDTNLCQKFCTNFFDSSFNNATSWQWIFEGADPSSSAEQNPTNICYDLPGVYDVTLITTSASGVDTFYKPDFITVNATPPIPVITQVGDTLTSSAADFYQWQFNTVDIPGATDQSYEVTQTGYYTVITSDVNGCASSTTLYVEITGIENLFSDRNISVFPNPTDGIFILYLTTGGEENSEAKIEVLNMLGQIIISEKTKFDKGKLQKEIQLSDAAAEGIYLVKVTISDSRQNLDGHVFSSQINYQK